MQAATFAGIIVLGLTMIKGRAQQISSQDQTRSEKVVVDGKPAEAAPHRLQAPPDSMTENTVTIGGQQIEYRAVRGNDHSRRDRRLRCLDRERRCSCCRTRW